MVTNDDLAYLTSGSLSRPLRTDPEEVFSRYATILTEFVNEMLDPTEGPATGVTFPMPPAHPIGAGEVRTALTVGPLREAFIAHYEGLGIPPRVAGAALQLTIAFLGANAVRRDTKMPKRVRTNRFLLAAAAELKGEVSTIASILRAEADVKGKGRTTVSARSSSEARYSEPGTARQEAVTSPAKGHDVLDEATEEAAFRRSPPQQTSRRQERTAPVSAMHKWAIDHGVEVATLLVTLLVARETLAIDANFAVQLALRVAHAVEQVAGSLLIPSIESRIVGQGLG